MVLARRNIRFRRLSCYLVTGDIVCAIYGPQNSQHSFLFQLLFQLLVNRHLVHTCSRALHIRTILTLQTFVSKL